MKKKRLLVQGWRFIHHSYALVAQLHCVSLQRRGDIELRFEDLPYLRASWRPTKDILDGADEAIVGELRGPEAEFAPETTLRFECDFSPAPTGRKFIFHTPEFGVLRQKLVDGLHSGADIADSVHVLTPSRWAAMAYRRFGLPDERIHVVPHGFEPRVFFLDDARRDAMRKELGIDDRFAFLNVGGMTGNKGIDMLLRAFARTLETTPDATLVLKGVDDLYGSAELLRRTLETLPATDREAVAGRVIYLGERKPVQWMANLMRAADCYVAPYLAEGFNLPVLEAAACGAPIICTAGGPTDEFTDPAFAWRIRSRRVGVHVYGGQIGEALQPDEGHLVELMRQAAQDPDHMRALGMRATEHVAGRFTWDQVTDQLVHALFHQAAVSA